jgi:hypothetical protein
MTTVASGLAPEWAGRSEAATIRYVNRAEATCGGHAPCYGSIQVAINAAQPGDTVQIQPGTYLEQVNVSGKNTGARAEASRIVIEADPTAPVGTVVLHGTVRQCTQGHAIRVQQSRFITIRGFTITGAGGAGIALMGGSSQTAAVHIERNRIVANGGPECDGGITIAAGNAGTVVANNLIIGNGRNGIATLDAEGGPHVIVQNTIHGNGWNGVSATRAHVLLLVNNAITGNGTQAGASGGRVGIRREPGSLPLAPAILLRNNLICGNRLGEIAGPVLDAIDGANLTPTGGEGPGVAASPGCDSPVAVYRGLAGADHAAGTLDDDLTPAAASPLVDRGIDPRTLLTPDLNARFEADYFEESVRPAAGSATAPPRFDIGAVELRRDVDPPAVAFQVPTANAHVRGAATVQVQASDGVAVAALVLRADSQPLSTSTSPALPSASVVATATWNTTAVGDGSHTLTAVATDQAQNTATANRTVIVDNTPPDVTITAGPDGAVSGSTATFSFTGVDNVTPPGALAFAWRLDSSPFTAFAASTTAPLSGLTSGAHTFEVKGRDLAGNESIPTRRRFTVGVGVQVIIAEPAAGATVPSGVVLVRGTVAAGGAEVGVTVNGVVAAMHGSAFAAMVPVAVPSTTLTAVATTEFGGAANHAVTIGVADAGESTLGLRAHPETGGVPLITSFSLVGGPVPTRIELDFDGDGQIDFDGPALDARAFIYRTPGLYFPRVRVTDAQGTVLTSSTVVQVLDETSLDVLLQAKWSALRQALGRNDVAGAVSLFAGASRDAYRDQLGALAGAGALGQVASDLGGISPVRIRNKAAEYELRAVQRGVPYSFHVLFVIDTDGVWRLRVF